MPIDFLQSSSIDYSNIQSPRTDPFSAGSPEHQQPEPLLTLLTSHHPLLSTAIHGSISAYTSSKSYSPRFRSGAEFVERLGSPVVNTMGTAGRMSGVESGVRWMLRKHDSSEQIPSNKRRRTDRNDSRDMDVESGLRESSSQPNVRRQFSEMSIGEVLPPYDDQRSPDYEAKSSRLVPGQRSQTRQNQHWGTKFMMTTSALTAALSEESLRSLKYCLTWVLWANNHLGQTADKLKSEIEEWNHSQEGPPRSDSQLEGQDEKHPIDSEGRPAARDQAAILRHIKSLKYDIFQTLKKVASIVTTYASGALPSNAQELVRLHLKSLPQRFHIASAETHRSGVAGQEESQAPPEPVTSAQRVLVLATAGLDMTKQVSEILNSTIVSAEEWCDKFGKKRSDKDETHETPAAWHLRDIKQEYPASYQEQDVNMESDRKVSLSADDLHMANRDEKKQLSAKDIG